MEKIDIIGLSKEELTDFLAQAGEKPFRAKQIWQWLYFKGVQSFDEMTNLSKELRDKLKERFVLARPKIVTEQISKDKAHKWLLEFSDGERIETVYIPELDRAGIDSFKIEGRAKSEYYTAIVTYAYRNAIDEYFASGRSADFKPSQWILDEMEKMSHREYTSGFNFGPIHKGQVTDSGGYIRNWDVCALFQSYENGRVTVKQRNRFYQGDTLEVVEPNKKPYTIVVEELYNVKDEEYTEVANKATDVYSFKCDKAISPDAIFRVQKK